MFDESETKKNLEKALQGEALAHLKYQFYRSKLIELNKKYEPLLDEIIHNEKEHGKIWFKKLHEDTIPNNNVNLLDAIQGETYEYEVMYKEFGDVAMEEGYLEIANLFYEVAEIERNHSEEFQNILTEIKEEEKLWKSSSEETLWKCLNCGHIHKGTDAPSTCPVCNHPQKYFTQIN